MRTQALLFSASLIASAMIVPVGIGSAHAQTAAENVAVDNSARNQRDRDRQNLTPFDQSNKPADLELSRNIRRALMKEDHLSTEAKNIKIITIDGAVTLRGPVKTDQEKAAIMSRAVEVAGTSNVHNELQVEGQ